MPVVGFLSTRSPGEDPQYLAAFRQGLEEGGWIDSRTVAIEYRYAENQYDRLPRLVADLAGDQVAVIATNGPAARVAKAATATIPIVFVAGFDPVQAGLVASLSRPGGNATGVSVFDVGLGSKRLELLHNVVPTASAIGVLVNPTSASRADAILSELRPSATALGLQLVILNAGSDEGIEAAFASIDREKIGALLISGDPFFTGKAKKLARLALRDALPAIFGWREFADAGGLMSYGTSLTEAFHLAGGYTGRILKGEKPAGLPVQQPTKFDLVINLKTAKALGLTVPQVLLAQADQVIE
ncbi:MAG TPA: ABC transporter substrate-binding protein [Stellaceae bacterium]|jgi:putative ABC transport system substrate-binding protein|nr:ABC transporter substrate-binding protein [Stellaceae bacterium]